MTDKTGDVPQLNPPPRTDITPWMIYMMYTKVTLVGFGGTMFWIRRSLVDDLKWLTEAEFAEYFALGQIIPGGANLFNMALLVGHRFAGVPGAIAAGCGFISVPFFVMVVMALLYVNFGAQPLVNKALTGMFAVVVGMMVANAFKMASGIARRWRPWVFCLLTFAGVGALRFPLVWVMLALAPPAVAFAWRDIAASRKTQRDLDAAKSADSGAVK
ncbi:MAG: chromate transporter [Burkholderiales bacterium]